MAEKLQADFGGYATRNNLKCSDGRTILADAFKPQDGQRVPLVWQHQHGDDKNVLGHGILENRPDGVYVHGFFNDTPSGKNTKELVKHGDIKALSIFANGLVQKGADVIHGAIKEVSLVLAGANPGAYIDNISIAHSDGTSQIIDNEAVIYTDEELEHDDFTEGDLEHMGTQKTNADVLDELNDDQKAAVYTLVESALTHSDLEGESLDIDPEIFESLSHEQQTVVSDLLEEALAHAAAATSAPSTSDTSKTGSGSDGPTVQDVFDSLTDDQKNVVYFMIGEALDEASGSGDSTDQAAHSGLNNQEEGTTVNVFENAAKETLQHSAPARPKLKPEDVQAIMHSAESLGSLKKAANAWLDNQLSHAEAGVDYGITNIDLMFPDAKAVGEYPAIVGRLTNWVPVVLGGVKQSPFAKVKTLYADITADEARAKGYVKGTQKVEEVLPILRRTTGPTTVYKKQRLDRDDILDITDFDVVAWLKTEIRVMLDEEVARAILIGDGRSISDPDKIKDPAGTTDGTGIRSILNDADLYSIKVPLAANIEPGDAVDAVVRGLVKYRGSGTPTFFTTAGFQADLLLQKDKFNRRLYDTPAALASAMGVSSIVTVQVMEDVPALLGIIVNLVDYTVGTNAGGEVNYFDFFDIDFNQNKYLMETRLSGGLTKPFSALVITREAGTEITTVTPPSFNATTNTVTIPTETGVQYLLNDVAVSAGDHVITQSSQVDAEAETGYYIADNSTTTWNYTYTQH